MLPPHAQRLRRNVLSFRSMTVEICFEIQSFIANGNGKCDIINTNDVVNNAVFNGNLFLYFQQNSNTYIH